MPRVTIGMPTFNRAKLLKRAIEQVLSQTFQDFELIIYNDGSTDDTVSVVESFNDRRITFINETNKGLPYPLNKVLELARGEYIIILHDHDKFNPMLIEKSVKALDGNPEAGFVFQACSWINSDENSGYQEFILDLPLINDGRKFGCKLLSQPKNFSSPIHACCMVRKSAYDKVGNYYDEKYGWYCDLDLWLRLMQEYDFVYLNEVLFTFTGRDKNHLLSKKSWVVNEWLYETHKKHIPKYFYDTASIDGVEKILDDKRKNVGKRTMLHSLISGDKVYLQTSILEFSKYDMENTIKRLSMRILSIYALQSILLNTGSLLQVMRKKIKSVMSLI
jgi:glycosyltransferase involved in cell wall biosynthesis